MDARVAPLYEIFKLNTRNFLNCLEGMDGDQAAWRPNPETNSAAFIALHLISARHALATTIGLDLDNPFGALVKGRRSIAEMQGLPALEELRTEWKSVTGEVRARFGELTEPDLARMTDTKFPIDDKSVLGVMAFCMMHESYHIGQLGLLRKQVGLSAMALR